MRLGIDIMGGDYAPAEALKGAYAYLLSRQNSGVQLVLVGDENQLHLAHVNDILSFPNVFIVHAPQVIGMHEHPAKALKEKKQSSIAVGFSLLAQGEIDAFISAGNTGAMLVGAVYSLKPVEGVLRPTISTLIPKENGSTGLLLDVGMNTDCKPEQLNQFAVMGSVYANIILGISQPRVALLNIGEEEGKGNQLAQATYSLLKENKHINFIGNAEGRDVFTDKADVLVCDGFTGNIILKMSESLFEITKRKQIHHEYFQRFNFENYGGTPVLGVSKPVVIGHGISGAKAFENMLVLAGQMIERDMVKALQVELIK